jgi:hypothetical protein
MADVILQKAKIGVVGKESGALTVLFNPSEYVLERSVKLAEHNVLGLDTPLMQFVSGEADTLRMNLFFDTYSASLEAGSNIDAAKLLATSKLPEPGKIDVRDYTQKIYGLMAVEGDKHAPPLAYFKWGPLTFQGYVTNVTQTFTKFTFRGIPVRARLDVTFRAAGDASKELRTMPRNSPDRTKLHTMLEGENLTVLAQREYGDCELWREIARANHIENPRLVSSGDLLRIPAL